MPLDAKHLADEFSPKLVEILESRKQQIIDSAGSLPRKLAIKMAWPTVIDEVPALTQSMVELLIWKFGDMTVDQLIESIDSIKKSMPTRTGIPAIKPRVDVQ